MQSMRGKLYGPAQILPAEWNVYMYTHTHTYRRGIIFNFIISFGIMAPVKCTNLFPCGNSELENSGCKRRNCYKMKWQSVQQI